MITLTRIRSIPDRYRARVREIVRAYTLVDERDEDWVDDFHAHRLAEAAAPQPASAMPPARTVRPAPRPQRPPRREASRRDPLATAQRR
jgi:hypothetical protein